MPVDPVTKLAGIIAGQTQLCPEDLALGINAQAGEAKKYLQSLLQRRNTCIPDPAQEVTEVDPAFAVCAARFLQAFQQQYNTKPVITRAWNSLACEAKLCAGNSGCGGFMNSPAPMSNHVRGRAMDVTAGNQQENMIAFANGNPKFGVCFPLSSWDKVHLVLAGIPGSERCKGPNTPCDGVHFDPSYEPNIGPPGQGGSNPQSAMPSAGMAQALRNYLNPTPAAPASVPATSANVCTSYYSVSVPSSDPCAYYSPGTASSSVSGAINTNANTNSSTSTAIIDLIGAIANPTSTSATASGTPTVLNGSLQNGVALNGNQQNIGNATSVYALTPKGQQTFTSQDLNQVPVQAFNSNTTFAWQILESLKQVLLKALEYLKPFGGVTPFGSQNSTTATMY